MTEMIKKRAKEIWAHQGFQRYFKNTGWMFFGQMFSMAVSFFIGAWLARYLGPENYGIFNYAIAFAGLFGFIAPLGVDAILNRDLVAHPEQRDKLMGTAFILKLVGGFVAFFSASISAYFLETDYLVKLIVVIFSSTFIFLSFNVVATFFNSVVESKKNVKVLFFSTFVTSLLKIILILTNSSIILLAVIFLIEITLQSIGYLLIYKKNSLCVKDWEFSVHLAINILKKSWLLVLSSATAYIYLRIDQVMIGKIMSVNDVGLYAVAVKMADIWYFVPSLICSSLFPAIINAKKNNIEMYKSRLKKLYLLMIFVSIAIALPVSLLSKQLIFFIFGSNYVSAASILSIYVWAGVGIFLGTAVNQYFVSESKFKIIFYINLLTMVINIILNLYLIPAIGLNGAAIATLISYLIVPFGVLFFDKNLKSKSINLE